MTGNPLALAARAKGPAALLRRALAIRQRYGLTPAKLNRALDSLVQTLEEFNCGASLPITAVTLERNHGSIARLLDRNIDLVAHGYTHVDCASMEAEQIAVHLQRARRAFDRAGIPVAGYRSPYLRRAPHLYAALAQAGFSYVSNEPILWPAMDTSRLPSSGRSGYKRAIDFYQPLDANSHPSLPRQTGDLVEIPVSLPDDEMLLDRLQGADQELVEGTWYRILQETHHRGELFTVQLHPERIDLCASALSAILAQARTLTPSVWIARLDEIADWWRARAAAKVRVEETQAGTWRISVNGPPGTTVLFRGVRRPKRAQPWGDRYWMVEQSTSTVQADTLPVVGLSPQSSPAVASFLRQNGYVYTTINSGPPPPTFVDSPRFAAEDERALLTEIERDNTPLVQLGRWPGGAKSALCISGDVDALTIWDYLLRALGQ